MAVSQGVSWLLPAALLAACGPLPGFGPETLAPPRQPKQLKSEKTPADAQAKPPSLAPLATQQQVVKAVTTGRRDPFARVLDPKLIITPDARKRVASPVGATAAPTSGLAWPKGLAFEGVLQTASESEAMVRYTPADASEGKTRVGSLQVGDKGSSQGKIRPGYTDLLPPGWQVAAIDADTGELVLRLGERTVRQKLQEQP
ncbi:MAG: hypothetical protein VKO39_06360 [Cyanobacteriota bacterium]|nr:hypothetical protein [Cyanobacteriota bacterium]